MAYKWIATKYPGVRYREHSTRKCGRALDRYFAIRYRPVRKGAQVEEGLGWSSEGWTPERAADTLAKLRPAADTGQGPRTLAEMRAAEDAERLRLASEEEQRRRAEAPSLVTFDDLSTRFLTWVEANTSSHRDYEMLLRLHILPELGPLCLVDITRQHIEALKAALLKKTPQRGNGRKLSAATVNHCLGIVRQAFNFARETPLHPDDDRVPMFASINPATLSKKYGRGVRPAKMRNRRERILTPAEVEILRIDCCEADKNDLWDLFLLSLATGLRMGEVVSLQRQHVHDNGSIIRVLDSKGRNRTVYPGLLMPEAQAMLAKRIRAKTGTYLFPGRGGGERDETAVARRFKKICLRTGINDGVTDRRLIAVPHSLRHTFATRALEAGIDIYVLMKLMGHEELSTTEIYLHMVDPLKRQRALEAGGLKAPV